MPHSSDGESDSSPRTATAVTPYRDPETGLLVRTAFEDTCERAAALAARTKDPLSLALLDLDHFGTLNDLLGRARADRVLRHVASTLAERFRRSDVMARWGDDEFAVLFPSTPRAGAIRAMEKALIALADERLDGADPSTPHVTFSAGVVEVSKGTSLDTTIAEALRHVTLAKERGRNRIISAEGEVASPRRTVLLVGDDPLVSSVIRYRLERIGVAVAEVESTDEALTTAANSLVSLVVLDLNMRGTDGFALLQEFRSARALRGIPLIVLSYLGSEHDMMRSFDLGADDYVHKPFSPDELVARARRLLRVR